MDALGREDWMDTLNSGGCMDALRRGDWVIGWMR